MMAWVVFWASSTVVVTALTLRLIAAWATPLAMPATPPTQGIAGIAGIGGTQRLGLMEYGCGLIAVAADPAASWYKGPGTAVQSKQHRELVLSSPTWL
jgi:hypothetical protein